MAPKLTIWTATLFFTITSLGVYKAIVTGQTVQSQFHCSKSWCDEYTILNPCAPARNCSSVGHRKFLDPGPCNCCPYCFDYIKENDTCDPMDFKKPSEMCGPYLKCEQSSAPGGDGSRCQPIKEAIEDGPVDFCMAKLHEYNNDKDKGQLGIAQFRPECDANGFYAPRQCLTGSICYCSNDEGKRIFGEDLPKSQQNCACARDVARLQAYGFEGKWPHCLPNGDYDELQCVHIGCFCRSFPNDIYPPHNITQLRCFNPDIHTYEPEKMNFYVRPCELKRAELQIEKTEAEMKGNGSVLMVVADMPVCDPDGNYHPVQPRNDILFCANPEGSQIERFQANKFSKEAKDMNCYCARTRHLFADTATGKPKCCPNGSYRAWQCIGSTCFCVDSYGRQDKSKCNQDGACQVHETQLQQLKACFHNHNITVQCDWQMT